MTNEKNAVDHDARTKQPEPGSPLRPVKGQVSELAGSKGGANIDDGQDFDPANDATEPLGANDEDRAENGDRTAAREEKQA